MASEWQAVNVGDLADSISITHNFAKDELIFLNTGDVEFGKILHKNYSQVKDWPGQAKKSIQQHDILFSEIRPANGHYAYVDVPADDIVVSTKLMVIRTRRERVLPKYLYHFLTSKEITGWLQHLAESRSGTFPQITFDQIAELEINLPPKSYQVALSSFLDALQGRIELNRRMNQTLEEMARAIFKSWFVDFDPVRAKAEGRDTGLPKPIADLFPNSFVDSELGKIPKGWMVQRIGQIAEKVAMGPFGSSIKVETFVEQGIPIISGQHLKGTLLEDNDYNFISEKHAAKLANANAFPGDVIFTHAGNIENVAYIPDDPAYKRYIVSQRQFFVRCGAEVSPRYIVYYFKTPEGQHRLCANASPSGVPSLAQPVSYLKSMEIVVPPKPVMNCFDKFVSILHAKIQMGNGEGKSLATLRDSLLPKLISGELRVGDAEKIVKDAI